MSLVSKMLKQSKFESLSQEAILSLTIAANSIKEKLNESCANKGVTNQHFNILRILKGVYPRGHPRCEISARMVDRSPDITRLLDKLVNEGLVKRIKSTEDMRQSVAIITKKGIGFLENLNSGVQDFSEGFRQAVGEEDLYKIISICDKILMMK